ncbi:hypothetical protein JTE90_025031 [Oedothorax gibbosus]|uniref:Reverse transcriptase/retrotransposon-derived protein RNase H-like domain-containing protein n=1 Tax=Oedothorax gibbosus TaxID=931172 RepID=A0AAV6TYA6_9ARAC|nr:hypothetical protein JTE90_025031 [Oedothorax gibbosus]
MFTKACNEFEKVVKDLELDERVERLQIIEEKAKGMLACEESCKKHVFEEVNETELEKELDEIEAYIDRARVFKKLEKLTLEQTSKYNPVLDESSPVSAERDQVLASFCNKPSVALQTLKVIRGNGKRRTARAIIDSGSQRSYLLGDTAEEMAYQPEGFEFLQHSLFGGKNTDVCKHDVFTLYLSSVDYTYHCNFKVLSQPVICESVPPLVDKAILQEFAQCGVVPVNDCQGPTLVWCQGPFPIEILIENESELIPLSPNLFFQDLKTSGVPDMEEVDHQRLNKRSKVEAIHAAPIPTDKQQLQAFLGLINFYHSFLKGKASIAEPLHRLLDSDAKWVWLDSHTEVFNKLKNLISSDSVLVPFDETLPILLTCDASPYGLAPY